jgi:hypothetical protein
LELEIVAGALDWKTPAPCRPGERQSRGPARHEKRAAVQAAQLVLAVGQSGPRTNAGRSGFRRKPPPSNARWAARKTCAAHLFRDWTGAASVAGENRSAGPANLGPTRPRPATRAVESPRKRKPISWTSTAPQTTPAPPRHRPPGRRRPGRWSGPCVPPGGRAHIGLTLPLSLPSNSVRRWGAWAHSGREPGPPPLDLP